MENEYRTVEVNLLPFVAEAFSINKKSHKLIDELYNTDKLLYNSYAKQNDYYNHDMAQEGNIVQEYYFKKSLGILSYTDATGDVEISSKVISIIEKGWKYVSTYINSHNSLILSDFLDRFIRKYKGIENIDSDFLNSSVVMAIILAHYKNKEIDMMDKFYMMTIESYHTRLLHYKAKIDYLTIDNITKEEKELISIAEKSILNNPQLKFMIDSNYRLPVDKNGNYVVESEDDKYYSAFERIFDIYRLAQISLRDGDKLSDKEYKSLIFLYTQTHTKEDFNVDNFLKYIFPSVTIAYMCKAYRKSKEYFFDNFDEKLYVELEDKDTEIKQLKKDKLILQDDNERLKAEIYKLQMENKRLNQELKEKDNYKNEVISLRNFVFSMDNQNDKDNKDKEFINSIDTNIDYKLLENIKSVIVGGRPQWQGKIKKYLKNSTFISTDNMNFDIEILKNCDVVFIYTNYLNHGLYYKVMDVVREYDIKLVYLKANVNEKIVLMQMEESVDNISLS